MCRLVWTMVIVTIVVGGTNGDYSARSWGDPHITTVDKKEYDFNGHGEYTFLKTGSTTVQVRTDYKTPGNKDSTIFVAVAIKDDLGQFEAQLNRTSGVVAVYKDGVPVCFSNDSPSQGGPLNTMFPCGLLSTSIRPVSGVLVGNGKVLFTLKGFGKYMKTVILNGSSEISITLDGIKDNISHSNLTGLAGGSVNMKATDGTLFNVSKPSDMFEFGESLRISKNESLFNYSLSSGNYSTYNTFSRPTFYEDYLTNLTELFNLNGHQHNESDIDEFNKTCNESKVRDECLLAIARSDDIAAGEAVNINDRHERYLYNMKHNTPPYFTDEIPVLDVYLADNHSVILNLSNYVHDNNTVDLLTFLAETNLPKTHFTLDSIHGLFNWTVLPSLRDLNDSIKITFTVHDSFNSTIFRDVEVNFCGCNKTSQCNKQHSDKCSCGDDKYVTGDYCEIRLDPCNVTTCFNQSLCNGGNITDDTGPCAPCPKGRYTDFQSDKQICHDEDECDSKYNGADKCDVNSNCTNTDGSYTCTCHQGYRRMSNGYQCEDIDECKKGATCGINEVCRNIKGNYTCDCIGGYGRKQGTACAKIEGVSYVLTATWQIGKVDGTIPPDSQINRAVLQTYLKGCLGNISGFLSIEIVSITVRTIYTTGNANSNRQRRSPDIQQLSVVYILHLNNTMEKSTLRASVANHLTSTTPNMTNIILQPGIPDIGIEQDGLCGLTKRTDCDPVSTNCKDSNGTYECVCKHGYERPDQTIKNLCYDVNECQNSTYFNRCTTHGGVCQNLQGSWNCTCPHDTIWMDVGTEDAPLYRCQRNHTYVGHVTFISFFNISDKNITELVTTKINVALKDNNNNASTDPPLSVREVFVYSTVLNINRTRNGDVTEYDAMFALRFGLPVSPMTLHDILASLKDLSIDVHKTNFTVFNESENKLCEFFNECVEQSTKCLTKSGTIVCECRTGFVNSASPNNCIDIDECEQKSIACLNGSCENIPGSWICHCPHGFNTTIQDNSTICQDIDECVDSNRCPHGTCNNTIGSYICNCTEGYYGNDDNTSCRDIDECTNQTLCVNGTCNNTDGSYHCECHNGFKHTDANNQSCEDIDECNSMNTCHHGKCNNTIGSYYCDCHDGFVHDGNDNTNCVDINECTNQTLCDDGTCINTNGSWHCDCNNGFKHTDSKNQLCEDINECTNYRNACTGDVSPFNPCVNLKGSWTCNCDSGHSVDLNVTSKLCSGVFRYLAYLHIYTIDNTNANSLLQMFIQKEIWSYYVQKFPYDGVKITSLNIITDNLGANATFVLNFDLPRSREDIEKVWTTFKKDTCTSLVCQFNGTNFVITTGNLTSEGKNTGICRIQNMCDAVSTDCISNNGQTTFECKSGFHKSSESSSCCEDINECEQKSDSCLNQNCENIPGSWICHCPQGYENTTSLSNSTICQDIDECEDPNRCPHGPCNNTIGSYICDCTEGYYGNDDNTTCHDINECTDQTLCVNGTCNNTDGSWHCECHNGFKHTDANNQSCKDIDECYITNTCNHGNCTNTIGSYYCDCHDGFGYDGNDNTNCVDINECTNQTLCDDGTCINTNGSWHCDCNNGFTHTDLKNQSCEDIDECTNYTNACIGDVSPFNPCVNLKGSWTCNCDSGHSVDLNVTSKLCSGVFRYLAYLHIYPVDNMNDNMNANDLLQMFIQREIWSYYVQKFPYDGVKVTSLNIITDMLGTNATFVLNFDLPRSREDIENVWTTFKKDTCTSLLCQDNGTNFVITPGNLTSEGKNTGICTIQNTCDAESTDCFSNNGQTTFECKSGFHKSSESSSCCEDINECASQTLCDHGICKNTNGSWHCDCHVGFFHTDLKNQTCVDINECNGTNDCQHGNCSNTIGSYYCDCNAGYDHQGNGRTTCFDINECTKQTLCDNGTCINTNGSWHCDCHNGFKHTDSKNQSCEGAKQTVQVIQSSFVFTVSVLPNKTELNTTLSEMIRESYESQYNRSDITVIILTIIPQSGRSIRSADNPNVTHLTCTYKVYFTTPAAVKPENNTLTAYLNEHKNSPAYQGIQLQAEDPVVFHEAVSSVLGGNTVATSTSTTTSTTTAASNPTTSKTTDENAKDLTTILIGTGSTLGGLVVILTVVVGCVCWRKRQPEKTKLDSLPEHITMDTFGPGHEFKPVNPAYSSSHHLNQSVMYDHFQGVPGSSNQSPYRHSREELSNSYNHAFHHQNRESLYRTSSLPGLPRIENGAVKVLPSGEPQRPPSPIPDYHDPDVRGHGRNPPSPKPDYMPHHEHNFESKRSYPIQNGIHGHVVRNGVSVLPMARPRSMDNLAPNYNHLPSGPIYSQPHKQRRGSFGNY